jgi:hypothetical protein
MPDLPRRGDGISAGLHLTAVLAVAMGASLDRSNQIVTLE